MTYDILPLLVAAILGAVTWVLFKFLLDRLRGHLTKDLEITFASGRTKRVSVNESTDKTVIDTDVEKEMWFDKLYSQIYERWKPPPFTFNSTNVELELLTADGSKARLTKTYSIRANYENLNSLVHRNLMADGQIEGFVWNDKSVPDSQITQHFGEYSLQVSLTPPPKKGETIIGELSYDLLNSFPSDTELFIYVSDFPTKFVRIRIRFPESRRCASASMFVTVGSVKKEHDINIINDCELLEAEIKRPIIGAEYTIVWKW